MAAFGDEPEACNARAQSILHQLEADGKLTPALRGRVDGVLKFFLDAA